MRANRNDPSCRLALAALAAAALVSSGCPGGGGGDGYTPPTKSVTDWEADAQDEAPQDEAPQDEAQQDEAQGIDPPEAESAAEAMAETRDLSGDEDHDALQAATGDCDEIVVQPPAEPDPE